MGELSDVPSFPHWGGSGREMFCKARQGYTGEWNPSPGAGSGSTASEGGGLDNTRRGFPGGGGLSREPGEAGAGRATGEEAARWKRIGTGLRSRRVVWDGDIF
jgi:hypothetical protein